MENEAEIRKCIHDLRNELNNLVMQSELLRLRVGGDADVADIAEAIVDHGKRASGRITDLSRELRLTKD